MNVDFGALSRVQLTALVAGGLSILLSFVGQYLSFSYEFGGILPGRSLGTSAWASYATIGMLLVILATAVTGLRAFAEPQMPAGVPWNLVAFASSALGTALLVLRAFTASASGPGVSVGPGWSGWLLFITTVTLTVCAGAMFKASGEKVPELSGQTPAPPEGSER